MNKTVSRLLGEEQVGAADAQVAPPEAAPKLQDYRNPTVAQLLALWHSGNHEAVALRVLDALDHYQDFLQLAFQIGHAGAMELGRLMDDLTSDQTSPHRHDAISDRDIQAKMGHALGNERDLVAGSEA